MADIIRDASNSNYQLVRTQRRPSRWTIICRITGHPSTHYVYPLITGALKIEGMAVWRPLAGCVDLKWRTALFRYSQCLADEANKAALRRMAERVEQPGAAGG